MTIAFLRQSTKTMFALEQSSVFWRNITIFPENVNSDEPLLVEIPFPRKNLAENSGRCYGLGRLTDNRLYAIVSLIDYHLCLNVRFEGSWEIHPPPAPIPTTIIQWARRNSYLRSSFSSSRGTLRRGWSNERPPNNQRRLFWKSRPYV